MKERFLVLYDVRGIQNYVYKTPQLKDAIGASAIVGSIISDALKDAVNKYKKSNSQSNLKVELEWVGKHGPLPYNDDEVRDVQMIYIGGGNGLVTYSSKELAVAINKYMSKYVLEHTYSLQLAIAIAECTGNYSVDYEKVNQEMTKIKINMSDSRPVYALPISKVEYATGLPVVTEEGYSEETRLKREAEREVRKKISAENKIFDNYIDGKHIDSTLAVVHIDGNSMGSRIRGLIENVKEYSASVKKMRQLSYNIDNSYNKVFDEMMAEFNKIKEYYVLKVLVGGDDITYVCNAKIAVATVEYFAKRIVNYSMIDNMDDYMVPDKDINYGFSICAGISYYKSHFPFSIAYEVAEACCYSAKKRAKSKATGVDNIGNFFDFQFCKNVQTLDIDEIRQNEYYAPDGTQLMIRPYELNEDKKNIYDFENLRKSIRVFKQSTDDASDDGDSKQIPRSFAKTIRNAYAMGQSEVDLFVSFLHSRGWKLEDNESLDMYIDDGNKKLIARYYDALELIDEYEDISDILGDEEANA